MRSRTSTAPTERPAGLIPAAQAFLAAHPRLARVLAPARWVARKVAHRLGYFGDDYERWIASYDRIGARDRPALAAHARGLARQPLVSLVVAVCDPEERFLRAAIESVLEQVYENWELCLADDASTGPYVRELLAEAALRDPRVKAVYRAERGGRSRASNEAAAVATGDYLGLLDHDDVLPPHALLMVADELDRHPEAVLVYSDEDALDADGSRRDHYFKPDWNPALIRSQNYAAHLAVLRRDCFEQIGGFRPELDGSEDWDLVLRATDGVPPERIRHVPHVLCHRRRDPGAGPAAAEAGRRAVADALARNGIRGEVVSIEDGYQRVRYAVPDPPPRVHAVVPSTGRPDLLARCLEGLLGRTRYDALAVTLAVNSSALEVAEQARMLEEAQEDARVRVVVHEDRPFNFARVNNRAAAEIDAPLLLLVNDDVRPIHEDWLERMVGHAVQDRVGAVGAMLYYPDDTVQHGGVTLGLGGVAGHSHNRLPRGRPGYGARARLDQDLSCVTAGCMLVRREAFDAVGGFDERFAVAYNDVDLCLRIVDAGWRIVWTPSAELYHDEFTSLGPHDSPERLEEYERAVQLMTERWGDRLLQDPHYSPNLSLRIPNTPAFPPRIRYPWSP